MITDIVTLLSAIKESSDLSPRQYSGRGMNGASCLGFTYQGSIGSFVSQLIDLGLLRIDDQEEYFQELSRVLPDMKYDNMGFDIVIYFPNIEWIQYKNFNEGVTTQSRNPEDTVDAAGTVVKHG